MSDVMAAKAAPLDEVMMAMDVVDTLRHRQDLATRELEGDAKERQLIDKLRTIYHQQGIEVPDHILKEGVAALAESRFVYEPPAPGLRTTLARLYVSRDSWGKPVAAVAFAIIAVLVGYFGVWQPFQASQAEQARLELSQDLPSELDVLYQAIYEETKVQQAVVEADALRSRGKAFAAEGNREGAEAALGELTALRDRLRQRYTVRVINRSGERSGVWTTPAVNTAATNFYLIVEAIDPDGRKVSLPIVNEENGETETVSTFGLRVPKSVYDAVAADKQDDGIIQGSDIGLKADGFLDVDYSVPVLGGAITRW
jgi:anti-sigma-K factor RskA